VKDAERGDRRCRDVVSCSPADGGAMKRIPRLDQNKSCATKIAGHQSKAASAFEVDAATSRYAEMIVLLQNGSLVQHPSAMVRRCLEHHATVDAVSRASQYFAKVRQCDGPRVTVMPARRRTTERSSGTHRSQDRREYARWYARAAQVCVAAHGSRTLVGGAPPAACVGGDPSRALHGAPAAWASAVTVHDVSFPYRSAAGWVRSG
jgi:hypothetical protein